MTDNRQELNAERMEYYYNNREVENAKSYLYLQENQERMCRIINCDCGGHYQLRAKSQHNKTKQHKQYLKTLELMLELFGDDIDALEGRDGDVENK